MSRLPMLMVVMSLSVAASAPLLAQGVVMQRNVSLAMARRIADAALSACKAKGFNTSVAVVDRAGQMLVLLRDEQALDTTMEMAQRKAYTARTFGTPTLEFQKRTLDPGSAAQRDVSEILALGGGMPIQIGRETIGGVGSSGSGQQQDEECAKAGVAAVVDLLK